MANYLNGYKVVKRHPFSAILTALLLLVFAAIPVMSIFLPLFTVTDPLAVINIGASDPTVPFSINAITMVKILLNGFGVPDMLTSEEAFLGDLFSNTSHSLPGFSETASWMLYVESGILVVAAIISLIMVIYALIWLFKAGHEYYSTPLKLGIAGFIFHGGLYGVGIFAMIAYGQAYSTEYAAELEAGGLAVSIDLLWPIVFAASALVIEILIIVIFIASFKGKYFIDDVKRLTEHKDYTKVMMPNITVNVSNNGEKVTTTTSTANGEVSEPVVTALPNSQPVKPMGQDTLPSNITSIGGHAFANNHSLVNVAIPSGISSIGASAFSNCSKIKMVSIPVSVKQIGYNAFFNCSSLERINYSGTKDQWAQIKRGSNWLSRAKTNIVICSDGKIIVNPLK